MSEPSKSRSNRVFKSLHKPLTYLGVERSLFYLVCVGAVGAFNIFNSILAGIAVFCRRLCLWSLGDPQRSSISSHSGKVRAVQTAVRRRQAGHPHVEVR